MNGNDRFLNVNDAHLRVTGGNVHASSFNLDQISITTTSTTSSTIDFLNETKAFNTRSNVEIGTANLFVDTTTSNVGIRTSSPEYALDVHGPANVSVLTAASNVGILTTSPEYALDVHGTANVGVLTANTIIGSGGTLLLGSHLIPTQHQQFDIGSAEKKIRHLFLSDNSLWIGDETKISFVDQKLKFLKRNKSVVPSGTEALGGNAAGALAHAQNSDSSLNNINQMKLEHWLAYTRSLTGGADKDIKDIFTDATTNYEATSASDAFKEHGNDIYSVNKLRLGSAAAADATLDVVGTIKVTQSLTVSDASSTSILGQAAIGWNNASGDTNMASFAQKDNNTGTNFALKQSAGGLTFINAPSNKSIRFQIAGQEKARFDTNGQLGIGTTTPDNLLHVYKANNDETSGILIEKASGSIPTAAALFFGVASTTETNNNGIPKAAIFYERNLVNGRGDIKFCNDAVDDTNPVSTAASDTRMIIKNNGRVGIGTVSPNEKLHVAGNIAINWSNASRIIMNYNDSYRQGHVLDAGTRMMTLFSTSNDSGGGIAFNTRIGLGTSDTDYGTEKMRIAGNGNVGIGKTPDYKLDVHSDDAIHIEQASNTLYETKIHGGSIFIRNPSTSGGYEHMIINNHTASNTTHTTSYIQFRRGDSGNGNAIGTISGNGSTISYGGQSDYRVKENIVPMPISGLDTINNLQPKRFNFIGHPDNTYDGFIAHELQEHIPMAVTGVKDEMRDRGNVVKIDDESIIVKEDVSEPDSLEEGTKWVKLSEEPVYQNVDLSKIVTYLVKAVQELSEENQTLKTRLDALENAA